jgi:hypothetical protein
MLISAEIRWFWPDAPPPALHDWFASISIHGCAVGGGDDDPRPDAYLRDASQRELGIKARAGKTVEVKGLVTVVWNGLRASPFAGPIEIWTKWSAAALTLDPTRTIETRKRRWLRKFDTTGATPREIPLNRKERPADEKVTLPELGCNVELTHVSVASEVWWTFAFEAFGKLTTTQDDLRAVAGVLAGRNPPSMGTPMVASYPAWLQQRCGQEA